MAKVKIVKKIAAKGCPTSSSRYREAHSEADAAEKRTYPKAYKDMKKVDKKLGKNELAATHDRKGNIKIESKIPKKDRKDVILHERVELKADARLKKKRK